MSNLLNEMKLRSGFEYLPLANLRVYKRVASSKKERRCVGLLRKKIRRVLWRFSPFTQVEVPSTASDRTRFAIKKELSSRTRWTREWALQSLARRFTGPSLDPSPHTKSSTVSVEVLPDFSFPCSFRAVKNSFVWKDTRAWGVPCLNLDTVIGKDEGTIPSWVDDTETYEWCEWEFVYRTPSGSLDARFELSKPNPIQRDACFCALHCPDYWWDSEECILCYNYASELKTGPFVACRSTLKMHFPWHLKICKSERARRYRRRERRLDELSVGVREALFILTHSEYRDVLAKGWT